MMIFEGEFQGFQRRDRRTQMLSFSLSYYNNLKWRHTFLFQSLTYLNFGQKRHENKISTCV